MKVEVRVANIKTKKGRGLYTVGVILFGRHGKRVGTIYKGRFKSKIKAEKKKMELDDLLDIKLNRS